MAATRLGGRVETTEVDMRANLRTGRARVNTVALARAEGPSTRRPARARRLPFAHFHQPAVRTLPRLLWCIPLLVGCAGKPAAQTPTPTATPVVRPFAALAEQRVIVAPAYRISEADPTGWLAQIPRTREYLRTLDDAIGAELAARGLKSQWVFPADLARAAKRNPTYAVDPYALAAEPLRASNVAPETKLREPLASQIRTMIALHDARVVLLPVELRFEKDRTGQGIAVLRLALLDGRLSEVRWVGDVRSAPSATLSPDVVSSLAAHLGDLIAAP
jgi:hypothetical protein